MKRCVFIYLCFLCNIVMSQNIMTVEEHSFKSSTYHDTRSFRVALPTSTTQNIKYNIILVLDADYIFDVIASTAIYLQTFDYIPPTAVVAIDYSSPGNRNDIGYDMQNNSLNSSGKLFYNYINTDLINEISKILPMSGFNTIIGHSYTASYLSYFISKNNDSISSYILFSPEQMQQIPNIGTHLQTKMHPIIRIITGLNDIEERQSFGRKLYDTFKEKQYDVKIDNIEADHMSIITAGAMKALTELYDKYYNIDSIYNIIDQAGTSVPIWDSFTKINDHNKTYYNQEFPITGSYISAFLWAAIQTDDKESIDRLQNYYENALKDEKSDPNALGVMGDLLCKIGSFEKADHYLQRCLERYKELGQNHETLYWRRVYSLKVLPKLGQCKKAWKILEECKKIYPDDKAIFCYYQGVLSTSNDFRIKEGIEQLKVAIKYPDILSNNFIEINEAKELLNQAVHMEHKDNID